MRMTLDEKDEKQTETFENRPDSGQNQTESEKKGFLDRLGAKLLSKGAMIFSSVWIAGLTLLKGFGKVSLDENEIISSGVVITAVWTPTFLSILADKIARK